MSPGPTATKLFLDGKPDQVIEMLKKGIPGGRLGEPEDIAGVVGFLVSEDAKWVTGQNLRVNGGMA